jgi:hypothetical protein
MDQDPRTSDPQGGGGPKFEHERPPETRPRLTVMTWNLYFGTDLSPIIAAPPHKFATAVANAFRQARATDFAGRATAWADRIEAARPDLIGLQEAVIFRTQSPSDETYDPPNATVVDTDMLELLLAELRARGLDYEVVTRQVGQDIEAPGFFPPPEVPTGVIDIRLTHHEVILVRKSAELTLTNIQGGRYDPHLSVPTSVGTNVELFWAWASVDVRFGETSFRFATTHLDPQDGTMQWAQAEEFLRGPGQTDLPLVWVGDFNSDPDGRSVSGAPPPATDTYRLLLQRGFSDAWTAQLPDRGGGFTCCQDADLKNEDSGLSQRLDLVLLRGALGVVDASVVGAEQADRNPSGLWPSDHAGLVVTLEL